MKRCFDCGETKFRGQFHKNVSRYDGLQARCKLCTKAYQESHREYYAAYGSAWAKANRPKKRASRNAYYHRNRESEIAKVIAWKARPGSRKKVRANNAKYLKKNHTMISARKRANKHLATPAWADPTRIKDIYAAAKHMTQSTGIQHHVDHIIPLQSPIVCGLHWEGNLQVMTRQANILKANRLLEAA